MQWLLITTAIPFGYVIIAALWGILFLAAFVFLVISISSKPIKKLNAICSGLLVGFLGLVAWSNFNQPEVEWNPLVKNKEELIGGWQNGESVLQLQQSGNYSCRGNYCNEVGIAGQWQQHQDFEIQLIPTSGNSIFWRITKKGGKYQFVAGAIGDPDMWQTHVTFTKQDGF